MNELVGDLFSFDGRIGRQTYWLRAIGLAVVSSLGSMAFAQGSGFAVMLGFLLVLVAGVAGLANGVKRAHDRNKSGYFVLISFIPLIGWIWLLIELGFRAGTPGPNSYGPAPGMLTPAYP